jgi:hypothetical protein
MAKVPHATQIRKLQSFHGVAKTIAVETITRDTIQLNTMTLSNLGVGAVVVVDPSEFSTNAQFELASGTTDATTLAGATYDATHLQTPAPNTFGNQGRTVYCIVRLRYTGTPLTAKGGAYIYVGPTSYVETDTWGAVLPLVVGAANTRFVSAAELLNGVDVHLRPSGPSSANYTRVVSRTHPGWVDASVSTPIYVATSSAYEKCFVIFNGCTAGDTVECTTRIGFEVLPSAVYSGLATPPRLGTVSHKALPGHLSSDTGGDIRSRMLVM